MNRRVHQDLAADRAPGEQPVVEGRRACPEALQALGQQLVGRIEPLKGEAHTGTHALHAAADDRLLQAQACPVIGKPVRKVLLRRRRIRKGPSCDVIRAANQDTRVAFVVLLVVIAAFRDPTGISGLKHIVVRGADALTGETLLRPGPGHGRNIRRGRCGRRVETRVQGIDQVEVHRSVPRGAGGRGLLPHGCVALSQVDPAVGAEEDITPGIRERSIAVTAANGKSAQVVGRQVADARVVVKRVEVARGGPPRDQNGRLLRRGKVVRQIAEPGVPRVIQRKHQVRRHPPEDEGGRIGQVNRGRHARHRGQGSGQDQHPCAINRAAWPPPKHQAILPQ